MLSNSFSISIKTVGIEMPFHHLLPRVGAYTISWGSYPQDFPHCGCQEQVESTGHTSDGSAIRQEVPTMPIRFDNLLKWPPNPSKLV